MVREVDLVSYLPEFMQSYIEPVAALEGENPEFDIIWKAADRVLHNRFILTADEYGISRFEKMLGIYPDMTDTLEIRRMRIQNRWFSAPPYTMRMLVEKITALLAGKHSFSLWSDFKHAYELILTVDTIDDSKAEELSHVLSVMVPENIVTGIVCESVHMGNIHFGAVLNEAEIIEIRQR